MAWPCNGELTRAASVLREMRDIDVAKTLDFFRENQGFCDCEIFLNVEDFYHAKSGDKDAA